MPSPLILITPHTEKVGTELPDAAVSLSRRYADAIYDAGGLPFVLPCSLSQSVVRDAVAKCQGVLLSGGEDVSPSLYDTRSSPEVQATVVPAEGGRDLFELLVIDEVFRQAKPLLAICRGQQIVNVALGGDLIADIALQCPTAFDHNRQPERFQPVHEVRAEPDSLLARLAGTTALPANSTHHQAVGKVAPPLRVAGRTHDGIVEALELAPGHADGMPFFLTVQFHPERLYDRHPEHRRLFAGFLRACAAS